MDSSKFYDCSPLNFQKSLFLCIAGLFFSLVSFGAQKFDTAQAESFAALALKGIPREYPNKPSNVMMDVNGVRSPREMHPIFYGSFDWHSSVHGHWMLVHLLRSFPEMSCAEEIQTLLSAQFTTEKVAGEVAYFQLEGNGSFERMYGWAWFLQLMMELRGWESSDSQAWAKTLEPLEKEIVGLILGYLPRLTWPIRSGTHQDTAFALGMILDYARSQKNEALVSLIEKRSRDYYLADKDYPVAYEPSGHDFFSSGLNEADLMRRILPQKDFIVWFDGFFPMLKTDQTLGNLLTPAVVSDVTDGHLVHLAGLNFNRAWTMRGVAAALPDKDPRRSLLLKSAGDHVEAGNRYVLSGHYEGEHWLAVYAELVK